VGNLSPLHTYGIELLEFLHRSHWDLQSAIEKNKQQAGQTNSTITKAPAHYPA
jgi:hypothetical protein